MSSVRPTRLLADRLYRVRSNTDTDLHSQVPDATPPVPLNVSGADAELPPAFRQRLYELFGAIEKEFEQIFAENLALHARVEALSAQLTEGGALPCDKAAELLSIDVSGKGKKPTAAGVVGQRLKTALRVPPGRLVSSLKVAGGDAARTRYVRSYAGHSDGVWHVAAATTAGAAGGRLIGTASADGTARLWHADTAACVACYTGHGQSCSVNSVSFRPEEHGGGCTMLTASGDQSAHIWKASLTAAAHAGAQQGGTTSEEELEPNATRDDARTDESTAGGGGGDCGATGDVEVVRAPLMRLTGHTGVVICADWLCTGNQVLTASWDRTANIYDAEKGEILNILSGHDQELNHCSTHPTQRLVVTASKDTTFRLWDFREPIHSVAVFQGHSESVNCAVLAAAGERVVSAGDDRAVKVWDLRNMRSALATLRLDAPANRLAVSRSGVIAIPHDNRHVRLYDLNGQRLARLPRANHRCHRRMVCCCAWLDGCTSAPQSGATPSQHTVNLVTCGFDKMVLGWRAAV